MKIALILLLTTFAISSSAPPRETLSPFELAMLDKLHQPWMKPIKPVKHDFPRKGETMCNGKVCKVKMDDCEDCQYNVPLEFKHVKTGFRKA